MVEYKITPTVFGERPEFVRPTLFLKELTVDGFRKMMSDFYDLIIDSDISNFFPQEPELLDIIKAHNTKYFIEIAGGPTDYSDEVGHIDMVKMHKPFSITEKARTEWLGCFQEILEPLEVSDEAKQQFWNYIEVHSKHTVNIESKVRLPEDLVGGHHPVGGN